MVHLLEVIFVLVMLNNQMLLSSSRLVYCIKLVAFQGVILSLIPIILAHQGITLHVLCFATIVFVLKGIIFPKLLLRALRVADVKREVEPIIGFTSSALLGILILGLSFWISSKYTNIETAINFLTLPTALYTILVGLFLIICRKKALMQVVGYLVLENGIYIFGVALLKEIPLLIEIGVLLDIFVAIFVMGIATYHISQEFETTDVDQLNTLRG